MKNDREYFSVALSPEIELAIPLDSMGAVIPIETSNICIIPGVANFWHGTINFKGSLLWVLDSNIYFQLNNQKDLYKNKYTAVVVKQNKSESSKKIALIATKLQGIVSFAPEDLEQLTGDSQSTLEQCCSYISRDETKRIFILNPTNLLEQLYQRSALASV